MKHSKDVRLVCGDVFAKLKTNGTHYTWRGWKVWQAKKVSNLKLAGKEGYYAEHKERGIWFTGTNLQYMRSKLPDFETLSQEHDGTEVPRGCGMTAERKEAIEEARPQSEKTATANKEVVRILKSRVQEAQEAQQEFLESISKVTLHHAVSWGHSAVLYSFLGVYFKDLLQTPEQQLPAAIAGRRKSYAQAMLANQYHASSSGTLHRAVDGIQADAVKHFIRTCDTCLRVYEQAGVELEGYSV